MTGIFGGGGSGGIPGGSSTQVQYNNSGAFGGITGATTDGTTLTLVAPILGAASATSLTLVNAITGSGILGTTGIKIITTSALLTDSSTTGTVAANYINAFGGNTVRALAGATTITKNYGSYFTSATAGSQVTFTNNSALGADSISIGGAAQGTNALAVTGTIQLTGVVTTSTSVAVGGTLSSSAGSGPSLTFNTVPVITMGTFSTFFTSPGNAVSQFGFADVDTTPVAQTLRTQGALAGGTSNVAGANWTFIASPGKGTGIGGSFIFQTAPAGLTGTTVNAPVTAMTIDSTGMTSVQGVNVTGTATPALGINQQSTNTLGFSTASSIRMVLTATGLISQSTGGFNLRMGVASATNPTFVPHNSDVTTGWGAQAAGNISAIISGAEIQRHTALGLVSVVATAGVVLKQGSNGLCGTFVSNGVTPVTVSNTNVAITDCIIISLNTVGGTVGASAPDVKTITAGTGFTVAGVSLDTSTYNYAIIKNAA